MEMFDTFVLVFGSGIRLGVPLILACLAGLWSERSGVVDIGLEGKMLTGAFAAAAVGHFTGNAWVGLLAGVVVAASASRLVHGYASIDQRANQIVSGDRHQHGRRRPDRPASATRSGRQGGRTPQLPTALCSKRSRCLSPTVSARSRSSARSIVI